MSQIPSHDPVGHHAGAKARAGAEDGTGDAATVVRSEERLRVGTRRVVTGRVAVRRRIVTEERTVHVTVRREELVIEERDARREDAGAAGDGQPVAGGAREPLVVLLREEVPEVTVRVQPYERVTVSVEAVTGQEEVSAEVRREVVETDLPGEPTGDGQTRRSH